MGLVLLGSFASWFEEIWTRLWLMLCQAVYIFINALYQVFEKVASVNLFSREIFEEITGRIYVVMGIAMLFIFAYNLILMIINPDDKKGSNNQMAKMIKEIATVLVLLVLLPVIFNWAYVFQSHILESNVIGQLILGDVGTTQGDISKCDEDDYECKCDFSKFDELDTYKGKIRPSSSGATVNAVTSLTNECQDYRDNLNATQQGAYSIAPTVLSAFYRPVNFSFDECEQFLATDSSSKIQTAEEKQICVNYYYDVLYSKFSGNIWQFSTDIYLIEETISDNGYVEFHYFWAFIAGLLAVYMFFQYAWQIGVRVAKLGFLQLISPIPVMMRIVPGQKEKIYDKWFNQVIETYLEVFIRVAIIYFCLFGISLVPDVMNTLWGSAFTGDGNPFVKMLATVFVILGLLQFAQEAPALFKEFFGEGGKYGLKTPGKLISDNKLAMGAGGLLAGGVQNMLGNYYKATHNDKGEKIKGSAGKGLLSAVGGLVGGARRGAAHGYKAQSLEDWRRGLKTAKYETDEARANRTANYQKNVAKGRELGVNKAALATIVGGIANKYSALRRYITEDGSNKINMDATQEALKFIEAMLSQYTGKANVDNIDNLKKAVYESVAKAVEGAKVKIGDVDYTRIKNGWKDSNDNRYTTEMLEEKIEEYYKERKRGAVADNIMKDSKTYFENARLELRNMVSQLNKLSDDFTTNLMSKLSKELVKLPSELRNGVNSVGSVSDLKSVMDMLQSKFMSESISDADKKEIAKVLYGLGDTMKTEFTNEQNRIKNRAMQESKK